MAINYTATISEDIRSGIGVLFGCLKTIVSFSLPIITPVFIASICNKHRLDIFQLQEKYENEKKTVQQMMDRISKLQKLPPYVTEKDVIALLNAEESAERSYLSDLKEVEDSIKLVLDYRCSTLNPVKTKHERKKLEHKAYQEFPDEFHRGFRNIFAYDYRNCDTSIDTNGQLWRIWMESWKAKAEARKYRNVVEKLKEKLKE